MSVMSCLGVGLRSLSVRAAECCRPTMSVMVHVIAARYMIQVSTFFFKAQNYSS